MKNYEGTFIETAFDANRDILGLGPISSSNSKFEIIPLQGGSSNLNYKVCAGNKTFFVKHNQFKNKKSEITPENGILNFYPDNLGREYEITKCLFDKCQITPEPIVYDMEYDILISEFVYGRRPKASDHDFSKTLALIGHSLNDLREVPIPLLQRLYTGSRICPRKFYNKVVQPTTRRMANDLLRDGSPNLFQFLEELSAIIEERLKYEPHSDCTINWQLYEEDPTAVSWGLLHNDLALRNIIITGQSNRPICFVDWEFADFGDMSYDLAYFQSENMLLPEQIQVIMSLGNIHPELKKRIMRYVKIFAPLLELANAYWTINHIGRMLKQTEKVKLRPPYSISENLVFIRNKIRRLVRLSNLQTKIGAKEELELFNELQYALRLFESQLTVG